MADYTTIDDPSEHFQTKIWTGNATSRTIDLDSNSTMQPDFSWVKERGGTTNNYLQNSSIGTDKHLRSIYASAQDNGTVVTYNSTGFGIGSGAENNVNNSTNVGWFWKANGGTRTTFTESGANPGGGHQANTTAGFSIVDYTGTGSAGTVSHGLGAKPEFIIVKRLDGTADWNVYHGANTSAPETDYLRFNTDHATSDVTTWNDTAPTTSVFSVSDDSAVNGDANTYIAFCWASKQGYSKFGKCVGNGNANGPFVYTGFRPAYVLIKNASTSGRWCNFDNVRPGNYNVGTADVLYANYNSVEYTGSDYFGMELLSNGFKLTETDSEFNDSGDTIIYAAFAEQPFVTSEGIPANAR